MALLVLQFNMHFTDMLVQTLLLAEVDVTFFTNKWLKIYVHRTNVLLKGLISKCLVIALGTSTISHLLVNSLDVSVQAGSLCGFKITHIACKTPQLEMH
jgi:hypothetical protein